MQASPVFLKIRTIALGRFDCPPLAEDRPNLAHRLFSPGRFPLGYITMRRAFHPVGCSWSIRKCALVALALLLEADTCIR